MKLNRFLYDQIKRVLEECPDRYILNSNDIFYNQAEYLSIRKDRINVESEECPPYTVCITYKIRAYKYNPLPFLFLKVCVNDFQLDWRSGTKLWRMREALRKKRIEELKRKDGIRTYRALISVKTDIPSETKRQEKMLHTTRKQHNE